MNVVVVGAAGQLGRVTVDLWRAHDVTALTRAERAEQNRMMSCCSRARTERLVLDL